MQRLREVVGEPNEGTPIYNPNENVRLDGQDISREDLNEKMDKCGHSKKIVEVEENAYKTLNRLYS